MDEETELILWLNTLGPASTVELDTLRDVTVEILCDAINVVSGNGSSVDRDEKPDLGGSVRRLETLLDVALPGVRSHIRQYESTGEVTAELKTQLLRVLREIHRAGSKQKEDSLAQNESHTSTHSQPTTPPSSPPPPPPPSSRFRQQPQTPPRAEELPRRLVESAQSPMPPPPPPPPPPSIPPPPNTLSIQGITNRILRLVPPRDFLANCLVDLSAGSLSDGLLLCHLVFGFEKRMGMPPRRDAVPKRIGKETLLFPAGVEVNPRSRAAKLKNIELAMSALRQWKGFSPRFLFSGPSLVDCTSAEGLELLQQMVSHVERYCAKVQDRSRRVSAIPEPNSEYALVGGGSSGIDAYGDSDSAFVPGEFTSAISTSNTEEQQTRDTMLSFGVPTEAGVRPTTPPIHEEEESDLVESKVPEESPGNENDYSFYSVASEERILDDDEAAEQDQASLPPSPPRMPHPALQESRVALKSSSFALTDLSSPPAHQPPPPPYSPPSDEEPSRVEHENDLASNLFANSSVISSRSSLVSKRISPRPFLHVLSVAPPLVDPNAKPVQLRMTAKSQSQLLQFLKYSNETVSPADKHAARVWLFRAGLNVLRTNIHPHRAVLDQEAQTKQFWGYEGGPFLGDPLRNGMVLFEIARLLQLSLQGRSLYLGKLEDDPRSFSSAKLRVEFSMEALNRLASAHGLTRSLEAVLGEQTRVGVLSGGNEVWVILRALSIAFPIDCDSEEHSAWGALRCAGLIKRSLGVNDGIPTEADWESVFSGQILRDIVKRQLVRQGKSSTMIAPAPRTRKTCLVSMERALEQALGFQNRGRIKEALPMGCSIAAARLIDGDIRLFLDLVNSLPLEDLAEPVESVPRRILAPVENDAIRRKSSWSAKTTNVDRSKSSGVGLSVLDSSKGSTSMFHEHLLTTSRGPKSPARPILEIDDEPSFCQARPPTVPRLSIGNISTPISAIKPLRLPEGSNLPSRSLLWSPAPSIAARAARRPSDTNRVRAKLF